MISDPTRWLWDSWYAHDGERHHAFFLAAPRSLEDPDLRHVNAVAGHAVSTDLHSWHSLPDVLVPGEPGRFDDLAIWTGSVVRDGDTWRMFYTGIAADRRHRRQRIGQAVSADLVHWERLSHDPLVVADERWYSTVERDGAEDFRDPWVFRHTDGRWHMLITATDRAGGGCVGHATSDDLITWTVTEPLAADTGFAQLEVLQVAEVDREPVLFFSCQTVDVGVPSVEARTGVYSAPADSLLGPFHLDRSEPVGGDGTYAGRVISTEHGPVLLGFRNDPSTHPFDGVIGDPIPLRLTSRGTVVVVGGEP
jgi:beta-fructofuranosidase